MAGYNETAAPRDTCTTSGLAGARLAADKRVTANSLNDGEPIMPDAPKADYPSFVGQLSDVAQRCYSLNNQINSLINRLFGEPTQEIVHPMNASDVGGTMQILYNNLAGAEEQMRRIRRTLGD